MQCATVWYVEDGRNSDFKMKKTQFNFNLKIRQKNIKSKCQQHPVFPGGHPSKYWLGSMLLNFSDRTRTGVFSVIWPLATLIAKLEGLTLKIKFKTVRWGLTEGWLKVRWALRTQIKIWKISNGTKGLKIFTFSARPPQQNIIYFCGPSAARPAPKTCRRQSRRPHFVRKKLSFLT